MDPSVTPVTELIQYKGGCLMYQDKKIELTDEQLMGCRFIKVGSFTTGECHGGGGCQNRARPMYGVSPEK